MLFRSPDLHHTFLILLQLCHDESIETPALALHPVCLLLVRRLKWKRELGVDVVPSFEV